MASLNFFDHFQNAAVSLPSSGPRYLYHLSIFLHHYLHPLYHIALTHSSCFLVYRGSRVRSIRSQQLCHLATVSVNVLQYHVYARSVSSQRQTFHRFMLHRSALSSKCPSLPDEQEWNEESASNAGPFGAGRPISLFEIIHCVRGRIGVDGNMSPQSLS